MRSLDRLFENSARSLAKRTSRRSLLASLGRMLTGAALIPLLPIDRTARADTNGQPDAAQRPDASAHAAAAQRPENSKPAAHPAAGERDCDYWRYCAIDGFLCSCCGGTSH